MKEIKFIDPIYYEKTEHCSEQIFKERARKSLTRKEAEYLMRHRPAYFASMMVGNGDADSLIIGKTYNCSYVVKPILQFRETNHSIALQQDFT